VLLLELWTWPGCAIYLVWPNLYVLIAGMLPTALVIPSTDSMVLALGIALTPDRLLGQSGAVRTTIALGIAPLGPLVAGVLLGAASGRVTVALFAVFALVLAIWGTLSPSIRAAPSPTIRVDELRPQAERSSNRRRARAAGGLSSSPTCASPAGERVEEDADHDAAQQESHVARGTCATCCSPGPGCGRPPGEALDGAAQVPVDVLVGRGGRCDRGHAALAAELVIAWAAANAAEVVANSSSVSARPR
jgi:hypothetical protein